MLASREPSSSSRISKSGNVCSSNEVSAAFSVAAPSRTGNRTEMQGGREVSRRNVIPVPLWEFHRRACRIGQRKFAERYKQESRSPRTLRAHGGRAEPPVHSGQGSYGANCGSPDFGRLLFARAREPWSLIPRNHRKDAEMALHISASPRFRSILGVQPVRAVRRAEFRTLAGTSKPRGGSTFSFTS